MIEMGKSLKIGILIVAVVLGGWYLFSNNNEQPSMTENNTNPNNTSETTPTTPPAPAGVVVAVLETTQGNIEITLDPTAAPKTSANFEKLVRDGFYDNLTFHRIIPGFVIQGGDPLGDGTGGPGYTIPAEIKLLHKRGSVATARTGDQVNPQRSSSGSQFYIALADLPLLDGQYTVFGQVTVGLEVMDAIAAVETGAGDMPLEPVIIKKAYIK